MPSPWKRRSQTNAPEVTMATLPPMCDNQPFEEEQLWDDNSGNCASMNTTISSTTSSPPAKPKRSFRSKRQEEQEATAYLEGCDHTKEEERRVEEAAGRGAEDRNEGGEGEAEEEQEEREVYLSEDGRSQTETDEGECSEEGESREEKEDWRQEEEEEENRSKKGGEGREEGEEKVTGRDEERDRRDKEEWKQEEEVEAGEQERRSKGGEEEEEVGGTKEKEGDDGETDSEDDEADSQKQEDTVDDGVTEGGEAASSPPRRGRRSRVIRLYQYDDDGQRYGHLPDPAPDERGPAPRLKQRSLSLTRLSAIMATASAGPLDAREERREETGERPHFHMDI